MSKSTFVICFNALENRFFEVDAIHEVEHLYRPNYYRLSLRLNFYNGDINMSNIDEMRILCFRKITKLMTLQNMWQNHHCFYVIDYEIRTIPRRVNEQIQQNNNESDRRDDHHDDDYDDDESENSTDVSMSSESSIDSAYLSPTSVATTISVSEQLSFSSAYSSDDYSVNVD